MSTIYDISKVILDGDWIESKDQSEKGIRLIQTGNIGIDEYIDKIDKAKFINDETFIRLKCTELFADDILISRLPSPVGRACILPKDIGKAIAAVDCTIIRLDEAKCHKRYFLNFTQSQIYFNQIQQFLSGTTRTRISRKNLEKIEILLPKIKKQQKIAAVLDKVSELIALRKKQLEKLDELVKSRFIEMFGDPFCENSRYEKVTLGSIADVGSSKRIFEKEYVSEGIPFYRTKEIVELSKGNKISTELFISKERFNEIRYNYGIPQKGDLLISAVGTIGVIWIVDGKNDFYFKDGNLLKVSPSNLFNSVYLKALLELLIAVYKLKMSTGTAYSALTILALKQMMIYKVPYGEQNKFANFVTKVDKQKLTIQQSLDKLEVLKKALMQQYFG